MQCKDIPDLPILEFLATHGLGGPGGWCNWFGEKNNVSLAMGIGIKKKLVLAKMRQLIKRGLADGCTCGCRGDFEITDKGREYLLQHSPQQLERP